MLGLEPGDFGASEEEWNRIKHHLWVGSTGITGELTHAERVILGGVFQIFPEFMRLYMRTCQVRKHRLNPGRCPLPRRIRATV